MSQIGRFQTIKDAMNITLSERKSINFQKVYKNSQKEARGDRHGREKIDGFDRYQKFPTEHTTFLDRILIVTVL